MTVTNDYNGFENWETWQVNLWSDHDQVTYKYKVARQGNAHPEGTWEGSVFTLGTSNGFIPWTATKAENWFRSVFPDGTPDMKQENGLCCGAESYDLVNWQEISDAWNQP